MPLPLSRTQVRKLGSRLRAPGLPSEDDVALLAEVLASYDEALSTTLRRLESRWGLRPVDRLKNTPTIIEKLRRGEGTNLSSIQDIAGCRIVLGPGKGRRDQDRVRDLVSLTVGDPGTVPRVYDRRESPSHGYRAVHVVASVLELPVEIQIRTAPQHRWAQFFEKLADALGRGIRYGEEPSVLDSLLADRRFDGQRDLVRSQLVDVVRNAAGLADLIAGLEQAPGGLPVGGEAWPPIERMMSEMERAVRRTLADIRAVLAS